jgi:hypothetical protein
MIENKGEKWWRGGVGIKHHIENTHLTDSKKA